MKNRVWDKNAKKMIYPDDDVATHIKIDLNGRIFWDGVDMSKDLISMQYTGLKDRNGEEIYEEDIVEVHDGTITAFRTVGKHLIEWCNGQFVFKANSNEEDDYINFGWWVRSNNHSTSLKQLEVIGNIYENPELLEV